MVERAGRKTLPGNTRALETKGRMQHGDPNPGSRLTPPETEATRAAILAGTCPFCGKTGFKLLAGHTYRAHGVDRMELRSMGGFVLKESICAPEVSDAARVRTTRRVASGELWRGNRLGGPRNIGEEGKRRQADKNRRMGERARARYEANPDRCCLRGGDTVREAQGQHHVWGRLSACAACPKGDDASASRGEAGQGQAAEALRCLRYLVSPTRRSPNPDVQHRVQGSLDARAGYATPQSTRGVQSLRRSSRAPPEPHASEDLRPPVPAEAVR